MKSIRIPFLVTMVMFALQTQAALLFDRADATWRWRPGTNEASAPISAWRTTNGFSDTQFTTAPAPFWYGDVLPGGTQIAGMQNVYLCIFLRKEFVITNIAEIATLRLGALVDDGFTAWINGTEVLRVNMVEPAGSDVTITNLAVNAVEIPIVGGVPFATYNLPNFSSYLVVGTNMLAVQVLQSSLASSDFGFDASLETILIETIPPTVVSASPSGGSTLGALSSITVTFSEPVSGVDAADFLVNGVAAASVTPVSSMVYTFGFPQPAFGTVSITWAGGHGITDQAVPPNPFDGAGAGATWQYTLTDQVAPTVASLSPAANATITFLTNISVQFSENVNGVDAADLRINNIPATGVSGVGDVFTFSFTQPATGLVQVAWSGVHGITDQALAPNAFVAGGIWLYTLNPNAGQSGGPVISEFMAANITAPGSLLDEDNESSDWVEIQNTGGVTASLLDWSLTDDSGNLTKWRFPATNLPAGGFLIVFASEKDRRVPGARLHTNFKLSSDGDYLALVRPDGSIASQFAPTYPPQVAGVSFGQGVFSTNSTLVSTTAPVRVRIPSSAADGTNWLYASFNDAAWTLGTNGVGFGTTNVTQADYSAAVLPTGPIAYWRVNEESGTTAASIGSGPGLNGTYTGTTLGTTGPRPPQFNGFEPNNNAPTFNGTTSYIPTASPMLNNRSSFTMAGWIKPAAAQAARTGLFGQNDCVEFGFISASGLQLWTFVGSIDLPYPFPFGEWHHIAAVGTGSQLQLYLDGTVRATAAMTGVIGTSAFNFTIGGGGIFDATGNFFNGQLDEIAVWDRTLSPAELLALFNAGTNPAGVPVVPFVKTDVGPVMSNVNATAYMRLPFTIDDASNVQLLTLKLRYDDGFVAHINGIEVARANAPGVPSYNSPATNTHSPAIVDQFTIGPGVLAAGANILAIQGLNASAANEDFLITAELTATHSAAASSGGVYMTGPTPGAANGGGVTVLGPAITDTTHSPNVPSETQDIVVTARVSPTFASVSSVAVRYRVMFNAEIELSMTDDGLNGDATAGDGIYSRTLPIAAGSTNGQMIRWYFRATDALARVSRWPLFLSAAEEEYLGTIVDPTNVTSLLPIFHLFAAAGVLQTAPPTTQTGADSEAGGRVSIFYDGEFYDNVLMELRGNTSATQNKKSHRLEFNRDHEFRHLPGFPRVRKTSLMAEFLDPAYIRQHLSFWLLEQMGAKTPFFYPVRAQLNGQFYALVFHNDVIGQEQVERMGYDPKGALYKAAGNVVTNRTSTGVFQKLEPDLVPPDYTDYFQLTYGIVETNTVANRRAAVFDMMDVPEVINHLAGARWCAENDDVWANMSIYRDTFGDQLWRIIPFDMNASWGQRYGGITPLDAVADNCKSHPLYGGSTIIACDGGTYNRIYDVIIALPETRQMLLRRQRTVLDRWVMEPGVAPESRLLETHIRYMTNLIWNEAFLDRAKWGYSTWTASNKPLTNGINELFNEFIALRRIHFGVTHNITNITKPIGITPTSNAGIPLGQPSQPPILVGAIEFNPASSNQLQEFICLTNPNAYAVDITGWKLSGGAQFTFKPGTVMPSNGVLYVSPNVVAFKQRTTGPRGGQGLFVVGPYSGQLNARGESIVLRDDTGSLIVSNNFVGTPSPAQLHLRVTEIMYNPTALAGNTNDAQAFEYLELRNISAGTTLNLNGVKFTNGIDFAFAGSAITSLAPGARALVVRNLAAFTARYGGGLPVAGEYAGQLENAGERLQLLDSSNEEILDFSYNNSWYPVTDGQGFSLVVVNDAADPDAWGSKSNWRASGGLTGSPGLVDPAPPALAAIIINELLTHSILPSLDAVELMNPTASAVDIGGWFLSDDFTAPKKYRITNGCIIPPGGFVTFDESLFNNPVTATVPFAFSSSGDEVWLSSGDANTNLTGYMTSENYGAAQAGVSFGRYTNSQGAVHFVAQAANSFGTANGLPRVGSLVISEVMYHPPDVATFFGASDNEIDEYVEIENTTGISQPLYDPAAPTNTWRLRDAVDFNFPTNVIIPPGGHVLVVSFNPSDAAAASAFRFRNGASALVPLYGPWQGKLDNSTDGVELARPNPPTTNGVAWFLADKVRYEPGSGWTTNADGTGLALQRVASTGYGNDPTNWTAANRTPGFDLASTNGPLVTAQPQSASVVRSLTATFTVTATGTPPIVYQWRFNGTPITGATNSLLSLPNVQTTQSGQYSCLLENPSGLTVTSNATLTVVIPADITLQPTNVFVRMPPDPQATATNRAVFRVTATTANPPLTYQWRVNGTNVPASDPSITGVTSNTLTLSNLTMQGAGYYSCAVSDANGTIYSTNAVLGVIPFVLHISAPVTVAAGADISLNAVVQAFPPPFLYSWRRGSFVNTNINSNSGTNFATFNSTATGHILASGMVSSNFALRLIFTNLSVSASGALLLNINNFITVLGDTDGDGLPDVTETSLGLDPNTAGPLDYDGDGMSNAAEFTAGTDPTNAASYLKIEQTTLPGAAMVSFGGVSNRTYTVQFTDVMPSAAWSRLADVLSRPTNYVQSFPDPAWTSNRFYRVVTPRAP